MISSTVSLLNLPTHDFDGWGGFLTCESTKIAWLFSLDDLFGPLLIIFSPAFLVELYPLFLHFPTMLQSFFHHFSKILHSCSIIFHHFSSIFQFKKRPPISQVVRAWDVRDVSDQVHSMGAKWVTVDFKVPGAPRGGKGCRPGIEG